MSSSDHRQRRDDHVEAVDRQAAVPIHAPSAELEVRQQMVAQVRRSPHVGSHVAAGRRDVVEDQVVAEDRPEVDDSHHDERRDDESRHGDGETDDAVVGPRPPEPLVGPLDDRASRCGPAANGRRSATAIGSRLGGVASPSPSSVDVGRRRRRVDDGRPRRRGAELAVELGDEVVALGIDRAGIALAVSQVTHERTQVIMRSPATQAASPLLGWRPSLATSRSLARIRVRAPAQFASHSQRS